MQIPLASKDSFPVVDPTPEGVEARLDFAHQYNVDLQVAEPGKDAALAGAAQHRPTFLGVRDALQRREELITRKRTSRRCASR